MLRALRAALAALALLAAACSSGDDATPPDPTSTTTSTTEADGPPATTEAESLESLVLTVDDLPEGFAPSGDVDDTVTTFCAGQDATAGLQATAREVVGFTRTPPGASVVQLVLRFAEDGAADFVAQAASLLEGCNEVPDATGLAFTYEPVSPGLAELVEPLDGSAARYGTSFGSGNLTLNVVVLHQGDVGQLVAVLGLEQDRADLDALAEAAVGAAVERLTAGS